MLKASKTKKRIILLDSILNVISDTQIYETIDYKRKNEDFIKQFMYQPLLHNLIQRYKNEGYKESTCIKKSKESLIWESNKQTVLHNMVLFGTQHRPDMEISTNDISIAVEVKKGCCGTDIRQGIGQGIVYSTKYDFVIFLFIDTSDDKRIFNSMNSKKESIIGQSLWDNYNIMFSVV